MTDEQKERLDQDLAKIGVDRLLADQGTSFMNTVGGTAERRIYAGEWLSRATRRRENTRRLMADGKNAFRRAVMEAAYEATEEGRPGHAVTAESLAEDMDVESEAVSAAIDYLYNKGLLEAWGLVAYGLTVRGIDEIEEARQHPERATAHFPAVQIVHQTNNNYGGTQAIATGHHSTITQTVQADLPSELQRLATRLAALEGGSLSPESGELLQQAMNGGSKLQIAASAEKVAEKSEGHKSLLATFSEEIAKKLAEKGVEAGVGAASWLYTHGPTLLSALAIVVQHGR